MTKLLIDASGVGHGEAGQVDAVRCRWVCGHHQVLVHLLRNKGRQRRHELTQRHQAGVQRLVGGAFVAVVLALPEAPSTASHVPRGQLAHKGLDLASGVRGVVVLHLRRHIDNELVQFRDDPAVKLRHGLTGFGGRRLKSVQQRVSDEEAVGVPKGQQELPNCFFDKVLREAARVAGRGRRKQVPAQGIGSVGVDDRPWLHDVALGLAHLLALVVQDEAQAYDVLVARLLAQEHGQGVEAVEPASGLVNTLAYVVGRELAIGEHRVVARRCVELSVGHRARVEPAVQHLGDTVHSAAAFAGDRHLVDVRAVQVEAIKVERPFRVGIGPFTQCV